MAHIAFTGGMNIRHGNVLADQPKNPVQDLHFRVEGPVVTQLQEAFANDWAFHHRRNAGWRLVVPRTQGIRQCHRPRHHRTARTPILTKLRWTLLAALARGANLRADPHAVFFAGHRARHRAESRRAARRARGHHSARPKTICHSSIGRRARCGGRCSNAAATSGSRRRPSTIPS